MSKQDEQEVVEIKYKKTKVKVVATAMGYYNNRIIREGQEFTFEGMLKNGKLPLWMSEIGKKKEKDDLEIV